MNKRKVTDSELEVFNSYQHFMYYIETRHIRAYSPWGDNLTDHFLSKLRGIVNRSKEPHVVSPGDVASWVQEMTYENQRILLESYIMIHHRDGWKQGMMWLDKTRIIWLDSIHKGIDPMGDLYTKRSAAVMGNAMYAYDNPTDMPTLIVNDHATLSQISDPDLKVLMRIRDRANIPFSYIRKSNGNLLFSLIV